MNHTGFCALTRQQYEWTAPGDSVVSEYNLVCGQAWQVSQKAVLLLKLAALKCLQAAHQPLSSLLCFLYPTFADQPVTSLSPLLLPPNAVTLAY